MTQMKQEEEITTEGELSGFIGHWLPKLEVEMQKVLQYRSDGFDTPHRSTSNLHYGMMHYHMGWVDEKMQPAIAGAGKRLRPILCLLACSELGGDPLNALPAAAAIELLHSFSLIHDDIEDGDEVRRHRPTLWKIWGIPLAINAGDGMFTMAFEAIQRLAQRGIAAEVTLHALKLFTRTCAELTEGQHLDISFEARDAVSVGEYMRMIEGKTASLIGTTIEIGALIANANPAQTSALQRFGQSIGLEFQIQDDILGIWGDPKVTGKAAGNDILRRKKSLPLLYALNHAGVGETLQARLKQPIDEGDLPEILEMLVEAGAKEFATEQLLFQHENAKNALKEALGDRAQTSALLALANSLLGRDA